MHVKEQFFCWHSFLSDIFINGIYCFANLSRLETTKLLVLINSAISGPRVDILLSSKSLPLLLILATIHHQAKGYY